MTFKYPRTPHLPWSQSISADDIIGTSPFENREVVVTRKMDGENCTGLKTGCHARSPDGRNHPSRDWAKKFWMDRSWKLPKNWRLSAENLYAQHSIAYHNLPSYLLGFAIWDETLTCLSWDDTLIWLNTLDIHPVEVLWQGIYDEKIIKSLWNNTDETIHEGYVVRSKHAFPFNEFKNNVAKFVRKNHVQTDQHWMHKPIIPNGLKS